jgi:hypothetical protein
MDRKPRVVKIFRSFEEQEVWDIQYYISLTPEARQRIARELRDRAFGPQLPRIRENHRPR